MGVCLIIRSSGGTDTSGATATAARVLSGYTCYVNDVKITGTMANQGTKTASLNAGGSYTIPAGYHSGSGKVTANALSGQTSATATAARILSGRTAWVNGSKLTGTMTNRGAISQKLAANGSYTVPAGWHNGSGKVTQSLTTQGAKNVTPTTTNQTACAASRWTTGNIVIVGASTLTAGNIKKGVKIFNVTGTFGDTISVFENGNLSSDSALGGGFNTFSGAWTTDRYVNYRMGDGGSITFGNTIVMKLYPGRWESETEMRNGALMVTKNKVSSQFVSATVWFNYSCSSPMKWTPYAYFKVGYNGVVDDLYPAIGTSYIEFYSTGSANNQSLTTAFRNDNDALRYFEISLTMDLSAQVLRREVTVTVTKITFSKV